MSDELSYDLSPRRNGFRAISPTHGAISPTLRQPKAKRNLLGADGASAEVGSGGYGRGSPNPFQPIRGRSSPIGGPDVDAYSMAGQTNVSELRRAHYHDPELMIKSCVKVFVTQVTPSYAMPWSRGEETRSTGSGFVVTLPPLCAGDELHEDAAPAMPGGRCIVTNAHVVENFSLIQVRSAGQAEKYVARALCIAHDCDIAVLLVEDEDFWVSALPWRRREQHPCPASRRTGCRGWLSRSPIRPCRRR